MSGAAASLHRLDNGVRVLCDPMPGLASACAGVWVAAGARHERADENGAAHLLEHMAFKGAGGRSARALAEAAESRGIWLNAATGHERTGFHARCLADDLIFALDLTADLVLAPHLDPADLELERGVVLQEIGEAHDDPEDRAGVLHQSAVFADQPLGRPILGAAETLAGLDTGRLRAFRDRLYAPDAMIVAAAGAVDSDAFLAWATARFGGLAPFDPEAPEPARPGGGALGETRDCEQTHLVVSLPGPSAGAPGAAAARVLSEILGGGMASRLFQDLRETRGLVYSVEAWSEAWADCGRLCVAAGSAAAASSEIAERVAAHWHAMAETGPSPAELDRARRILEASLMMGCEGPAARVEAAVGQTFTLGAPMALADMAGRVRAVTAEDVRAVARAALSGPAAACVGPKRGLASAGRFLAGIGV